MLQIKRRFVLVWWRDSPAWTDCVTPLWIQVEQAQAMSEQEQIERDLVQSSMLQSEEDLLQEEIMRQVMMDSLYER